MLSYTREGFSKHSVVHCISQNISLAKYFAKYSKHIFKNTTFNFVHAEFMQSKLRDEVVQNKMQAIKGGLQVPTPWINHLRRFELL